ncbi:MAG TPA: hypothetical protein VIC08_12205 [Cellvibrionaceae bacterium]
MNPRFILLIIIALASLPAHAWTENRLGLGLGVGLLYGSEVGVKLDYRINERLAVTLGQGHITPSVGLQWYFRDPVKRWQPRFGLHHGVVDSMNVYIDDVVGNNDYQREEYFRDIYVELGSYVSLGRNKSHAIEFAFSLALGDGGKDKRREELGLSKGWFESLDKAFTAFNIGYRYNF